MARTTVSENQAAAERLRTNQDLQNLSDSVQQSIIRELISVKVDGKPETTTLIVQLVMKLQMQDSYQRNLTSWTSAGRLEDDRLARKKKLF